MNRLTKTVILAMMLMALPLKQWAQTIKNSNIEIELSTISNPDYRYCLLSKIANDYNISYLIDEEAGSVLLFSKDNWDDQQFQAYFDDVRMQAEQSFNTYTTANKEAQGAMFTAWKEQLPQDIFVLLFKQLLIENPPHRDGNQTCATADPFCTTDVVNFYIDASVTGSCESGPDYGCMSPYTARPPYWFYMKIGVAGTFTIQITNSNNNDLDFCCWGPFSDPNTPCTSQLTSNKIIDCDSPYNSVQECTIPSSSQVGQYYLMVITRYSSGSTTVTFSKVPGSGPGETDCGILPPLVDNNGPYCVGQTINLTANGQAGATYSWTGPGGFTSNQQNPSRPNCTMAMAGTYTCTIALGGATNSATTEVVVFPQPTANFNFTTVCQGNSTQFTSTSTTNPSGQQITSYQWNFGDGQTSTQQNPSHTYANSGTYTVTLTVACGDGLCTSTKVQSVTVYAQPVANAGPDQTIPYGSSTQLSGSGGAGTFNFHWEPANMVTNPNAQNTQTVVLTQDQTYTLTVTNSQGGCTSTDEVTIHINGGAMTVNATASPNTICQGGSTQLAANAGGGTGNFTYSWTPTTGLSNPNIYNPIATPTQTTTYTCHVSDGQTSQNVSVTVTVNDVIEEHESMTICPGDVYHWHGGSYDATGTYHIDTVTDQGCDKTIYLHLDLYPTYDETTITEAICYGESYTFYGTPYYTSTNPSSTYYVDHSIHGCDSIVRLNLTVWPENEIDLKEVTVCPDLLPYHFYGEDYYDDVDVTVLDTDIHGCDSAVRLVLTVRNYYMPEVQPAHVCYNEGETPTFDWNPIGNYHFELHEDGLYTDTLPTESCEGIFRLDLHFMQTPEEIHVYDTTCDTNPYTWYFNGQPIGGPYNTDNPNIEDEYHIPMYPFPCSQDYYLHLTVNQESIDNRVTVDCNTPEYQHVCNIYTHPDPYIGDIPFYKDTDTILEGQTPQGCPYKVDFHLKNMKYSPNPKALRPSDASTIWFGLPEDPNVPDTAMCAAVVTNTEFFSFQYTFQIDENKHECEWNSCKWEISKPSWTLGDTITERLTNPNGTTGNYYSKCTVYVADRQDEYVVLTATINNSCGTEVRKIYLKSSFLDVDENGLAPADVNIVPNPNNGQMHIDFENMEGRTAVKVFDMTGNQIDAFETIITSNRYNYDYNMKKYADGIYFFVVSNNNRVLTKKVVVIH